MVQSFPPRMDNPDLVYPAGTRRRLPASAAIVLYRRTAETGHAGTAARACPTTGRPAAAPPRIACGSTKHPDGRKADESCTDSADGDDAYRNNATATDGRSQ